MKEKKANNELKNKDVKNVKDSVENKDSLENVNEKKDEIVEIPIGKYIDNLRKNPWMVVSVLLAIVIVVMAFSRGGGNVTADVISTDDAGKQLVSFLNSQGKGDVQLVSTVQEGSLYKSTVNFQGQDIPVYTTLDGKYVIPQVIPLSGLAAQPPQQPKENVEVNIGDSPIKGSKEAKVTIVEFSDFQCPFCGKFFQETLSQIDKDYIKTGKVKLVFKDFPLDIHEKAQKAAEAARCVREQINDPGYYRMHDKMFTNQESLSKENYKKWARELDVDGKKFDSCLDSGKFESVVKADLEYGQQLGVSGTPAFFINGKLVEGAQPYSVFKEIIDSELNTNKN
ncbi:DsbA family protein [Candidatus Pacearchaeota archaeon]|nr:DsbA family protein [Candidatus Pacearchaeota archaeon]